MVSDVSYEKILSSEALYWDALKAWGENLKNRMRTTSILWILEPTGRLR